LSSAFLPQLVEITGKKPSFYTPPGVTSFYTPPRVTREQYDHYLAIRAPVLGWPSPYKGESATLDGSGARRSPAFPSPGNECVSLYGDSFTFGEEVSNQEAWGNLLAQGLGCRVSNFGYGGYGTDQALLRFIGNNNDSAPLTILGIYVDNLLRNVNQYRYFLTGTEPLGLKPRFILENGELKLVPIAKLSFDEFQRALSKPESVWQHETFLSGSSDGPIVWSFPYTLSLMRLVASSSFSHRIINKLRRQPSWLEFYREDHPSGALPTTVAIVSEFGRVAIQRGKSMLVVIFPNRQAFDILQRTGLSPLEPLVEALNGRGIQVIDLTKDFATYLRSRSFCDVVTSPFYSRQAGFAADERGVML